MSLGIHHAVLFEGEHEATEDVARAYIREVLGVSIDRNPDIWWIRESRLMIEHARALQERSMQKPLGTRQVFVVQTESILMESQNALLKLLEEPGPGTHIILLLPRADSLLPTVRSRLLFGGRHVRDKSAHEADDFLAMSREERTARIALWVKNKDRRTPARVVEGIIARYHREGVVQHARELRGLLAALRYLRDRSSSVKLLMEHCNAILPPSVRF